MKYTYQNGNDKTTVEVEKSSQGYRVVLNGQEYDVSVLHFSQGEISFGLGDHTQTAHWAVDGPRRWISLNGKTYVLTGTSGALKRGKEHGHSGERTILAPMPGHVRAVQVAVGDTVTQGQTLFILEAMKMEIRVQAPHSGQVAQLFVQPGQAVEREQPLAEVV